MRSVYSLAIYLIDIVTQEDLYSKKVSCNMNYNSKNIFYKIVYKLRASLVAQLVENPPAMQETWVRSLGWQGLLEKGKATHSSILAWRIPWTV